MTVQEVKEAVEAVKVLMEESIFLSNVRHSIPDVLEFTRGQFHRAAAEVRRSTSS